jgi:DNA-directed RNA polymerase subunit RPC12/RpoP
VLSIVSIRFFSIPSHRLVAPPQLLPADALVEPELPASTGLMDRALAGIEFRDQRVRDRLTQMFSSERLPRMGAPGPQATPSLVFAQPPQDLPALLRMADQLEAVAAAEEGERALVWKCQRCATRYAVPLGLVRDVSIRCERCGEHVSLRRERSTGEEALVDPMQGAVNIGRRRLAAFLRESMASGWPVLVSQQAGT